MFMIKVSPSDAAVAGFVAEPSKVSEPREFAALFADWPQWMLDIELLAAVDNIGPAN